MRRDAYRRRHRALPARGASATNPALCCARRASGRTSRAVRRLLGASDGAIRGTPHQRGCANSCSIRRACREEPAPLGATQACRRCPRVSPTGVSAPSDSARSNILAGPLLPVTARRARPARPHRSGSRGARRASRGRGPSLRSSSARVRGELLEEERYALGGIEDRGREPFVERVALWKGIEEAAGIVSGERLGALSRRRARRVAAREAPAHSRRPRAAGPPLRG